MTEPKVVHEFNVNRGDEWVDRCGIDADGLFYEFIGGKWHSNNVRPDIAIARELARLAAEVERLRGLYENPDGIDETDKSVALWLECKEQRDALAERVAELEGALTSQSDHQMAGIRELQTANTRLREALEQIAADAPIMEDYPGFARAALKREA